MKKKPVIAMLIIILLCLIYVIYTHSFQDNTLNKLMLQNDFDINKVDRAELSQLSYNWNTRELKNNNILDTQSVLNYYAEVSNIKLSKYRPLFKKSEYNFDYYNDVYLVSLELAYENHQFIITFHNVESGICNILVNNNGIFSDYSLYFNSFEDFLFDN